MIQLGSSFPQIDRYTEYMKAIIAEANQDHSSKMKSFESDKVKLESGISEQKKRETIMIDSESIRLAGDSKLLLKG
jgi:hypothetical protein